MMPTLYFESVGLPMKARDLQGNVYGGRVTSCVPLDQLVAMRLRLDHGEDVTFVFNRFPPVSICHERSVQPFSKGCIVLCADDLVDAHRQALVLLPLRWMCAACPRKPDTALKRFLTHPLSDKQLTRMIFQMAGAEELIKP